jgi:nucleotide-binding universal stress UspA family protein
VVLVGVDDTLTAQRAVSYAAGVTARSDALLIVVHSRPVPVPAWSGLGLWPGQGDVTFAFDEELAAGWSAGGRSDESPALGVPVLDEAVLRAREEVDRVEHALGEGDPVPTLCQVAEDRCADVIVVGSSRALRHRVCGSVSSRLLAHGHWPVIVVP